MNERAFMCHARGAVLLLPFLVVLAFLSSPVRAQEMKTLYTCGMHPEVISDEPGMCPKCDMKLTPMDKDRARMILAARGEIVPEDDGGGREREILYWRAPMDPTYIRNEPGKSPMGMDLVPVYADDVAGGPTIRIDPVTEQNMGVRYDVVRRGPLDKSVRTVGTIAYDEQSIGTVTTKIDGWAEKVYVDSTGTQVHEGEKLFDLYSPELYSAQEEYLVALRNLETAEANDSERTAELARSRSRSARERLLFFDIGEDQIDALRKEKRLQKTLPINARLTGIVTKKNVQEGDHLKAGQPAYTIADLSTVWVMGKVYESDLPYVKLGQEAEMRLDYLPGRTYHGRVTYIYPYLEEGTREIPVRMEFHNPGYVLKPGMYATIELKADLGEAVLVPSMAVIKTGEREVAFVSREAGKFEPREVQTGLRNATDELQVLSGLAPGEKVVVSGQFLLDSESRLREATLKMLSPGMKNTSEIMEHDPDAHEEMDMGDGAAGGETKWVCPMPSHAGIYYDESGDCPLCGMMLVPVDHDQDIGSAIDHYTCPMPQHYHINEDSPGKCPECGMTLIPVTKAELERFAVAKDDAPPNLYTCPMPSHAHVVSEEAGKCPECGMKLVPTESVPHGRDAELKWEQDQAEARGETVLYVCPMESHKHIVSDEPGRCPDCNMKLVPTSEVDFGAESERIWHEEHGG
ncbi:efflux RND transporter periplasmic adaptor subunit [bacterium]|nr:efflux RND transporter periplasmic adaptor subunit [bacterium]